MPIPHIDDYKEKKENYSSWYLLGFIVGVGIFVFFLLFTKAFIFLVKLAMEHGIRFGIGILILLIIIKKLKKRKRIKEAKKNENLYRRV